MEDTHEVEVRPDEQQEDQQHIDDMVAKAEGQTEETTEEPLYAGKYKSLEDLGKGIVEAMKAQGKDPEEFYKELESGIGTSADDTEDQLPQGPEDKSGESDKASESSDADNRFDFTKYEQELVENGELSEESYKELEAKGFPRELVDGYLAGRQALAEKEAQQVYKITGGPENYQQMIAWAENALSPEEIETFNQQISAGINSAKFAVEALYSRYTKAQGIKPKKLIKGNTPSSTSSDRYNSKAELIEDMSNPKYKTDPAFRKAVEEKLARSDIL